MHQTLEEPVGGEASTRPGRRGTNVRNRVALFITAAAMIFGAFVVGPNIQPPRALKEPAIPIPDAGAGNLCYFCLQNFRSAVRSMRIR